MNEEDLLEIRRNYAKSQNRDRWSIGTLPPNNKEYSQGRDKDGLSKDKRDRVEAAKEKINCGYDDIGDLFF